MAFFKFRKGGDEQAAAQPSASAAPESMDVLRRRARNRLIGAVILVLIAVIGFPLLVDKEPRPVAADMPITIPAASGIPARDQLAPLSVPSTDAAAQDPAQPQAPASAAAAQKAEQKPELKPQAKPDPKPQAKAATRYVVQVGSFADVKRAKEARGRLERAGFRYETKKVETKNGSLFRVRAGPFDSRAEAERAAAKIRKLGMPADILTQ